MFCLDNTCRYWLYNKPVDMRKSFNGLSGIVTNAMCERLRSGDVFIFANASRNMMKLLCQEDGGLVLYSIRLDMGRKNFLFAGNHEAAIRAAIVYSLLSSCKAAGIEPREWLEDILVRLPGFKGDLAQLLPGNWQAPPATTTR